jgi:DNA polymerase-4
MDTAKRDELETALLKLTEMVAARLREHKLYTRTVSLKLRDEDFVTVTRAATLDHATQLDREIGGAVTELFRKVWDGQKRIRLLGVHAGGLQPMEGQMNLLEEEQTARMREVFRSVDHIRDKYGDAAISLAKTLKAGIRERVQDSPARRTKKD